MLRRILANVDVRDVVIGGSFIALFVGVAGKVDVFAALIVTALAIMAVTILAAFAAR